MKMNSSTKQKTGAMKRSKPMRKNAGPPRKRRKTRATSKDAAQDRAIRDLKETVMGGYKESETVSGEMYVGDVVANTNPETIWISQMAIPTNPVLLAKKGGEGTPLFQKASIFGKFRIKGFTVLARPLIGASAARGMTLCLSANHSAGESVGPENYNQFLQRQHSEAVIGRETRFKPRCEKTWKDVDTSSGSPQTTSGGSVVVGTMGLGVSAYTGQELTGSVWRITVRYTYGFANFQDNTNMKDLIEAPVSNVEIMSDQDGQVLVGVPQDQVPSLRQYNSPTRRTGNERAKSAVWTVAGVAADAVSIVFPPAAPFLKAGLWILKAIFGVQYKGRNGTQMQWFSVHASKEAAADNAPVVGTPGIAAQPLISLPNARISQQDTPLPQVAPQAAPPCPPCPVDNGVPPIKTLQVYKEFEGPRGVNWAEYTSGTVQVVIENNTVPVVKFSDHMKNPIKVLKPDGSDVDLDITGYSVNSCVVPRETALLITTDLGVMGLKSYDILKDENTRLPLAHIQTTSEQYDAVFLGGKWRAGATGAVPCYHFLKIKDSSTAWYVIITKEAVTGYDNLGDVFLDPRNPGLPPRQTTIAGEGEDEISNEIEDVVDYFASINLRTALGTATCLFSETSDSSDEE
uniref:Capsid protein n=1 Tax=Beihai cephalopholis spiloparaea astrovirus TaxID=2116122 RepID=A0A2P1GMD0_9VIRU|nr:capsid protein [Beihai cephalopholis spiloparaea astrovirus]